MKTHLLPPSEVEKAFREEASVSLEFLSTEYGFSIIQEHDWLFVARASYCEVHAYIDRGRVVVEMKPTAISSPPGFQASAVDVSVIARCLDPGVDVGFSRAPSAKDVGGDLRKYVAMLRQQCEPMLRNDFTCWHQVQECLDAKRRHREADSEALQHQHRVTSIRERAREAWRAHDFVHLVDLYEQIETELTATETAKLRYAKAQIDRNSSSAR